MSATVYLVGAGPGDVGLLTVRGAELLQRADVVIYDYLANEKLLKLCPPTTEKIYVGKSAGEHTKTQEEIQEILVEKARGVGGGQKEIQNEKSKTQNPNRVIVRLKGGDPYVFGRGGEEGEFLQKAGVPFEVVPGITAGIAAPAYAGIPVTHRDFASTITFVTGHEREGAEDERVDYPALAKLGKGSGTIVFYMGVKGLRGIMQKLLANGMDAETPAAVIRWGTRPDQQTVTATVQTIADEVKHAKMTAPAITVVGKVVGLRKTLNWFEERPLFGKRVLVTRTRQQASDLSARLGELGAQVIEAATIEVVPPEQQEWQEIDRHLMQLPAYDWVVFTSANGVRAAWNRLRHLTFDARHFGASHVGAVGAATAAALEEIGIAADVVPEKFQGEEMAAALKKFVGEGEMRGKRFLLLRADIARPALREELLKMGALVEDVAIYQTRRPERLADDALTAIENGVDWLTFTSGSTAENLWELLSPELRGKVAQMKRVSIGPTTTAALEKVGWAPTTVAKRADIGGVVEAILEHEKLRKVSSP